MGPSPAVLSSFPAIGMAHYGASKAGMEGFMRSAAIEFAKHGITINAVRPGNILTAGLTKLGEEYLLNQVRKKIYIYIYKRERDRQTDRWMDRWIDR